MGGWFISEQFRLSHSICTVYRFHQSEPRVPALDYRVIEKRAIFKIWPTKEIACLVRQHIYNARA